MSGWYFLGGTAIRKALLIWHPPPPKGGGFLPRPA